jgi:hypothetical protein
MLQAIVRPLRPARGLGRNSSRFARDSFRFGSEEARRARFLSGTFNGKAVDGRVNAIRL